MCGIYGKASIVEAIELSSISTKRDRLAHRGPDDCGTWISRSGTVGLAHRRLAVIDLTPTGHQPMSSQDLRYTIVYNGEVYNFGDLRRELQEAGFCFRGNSDTEVILAAYIMWGEECLARFNGMFAFAIHDEGTANQPPSLFLARDRAGEKPLYYHYEQHRFEFASEPKALDSSSGIDTRALNYYLSLGYIPSELCLTEGVRKLPPATAARLDLDDFSFRTWQYWKLPKHDVDACVDGNHLVEEVEALLDDAVRLRMISDVPLGVLLSGGLDSSLLVGFAARHSSVPVRTFNISLPGSALDESRYARDVANYYGTDHHVLEANHLSMDVIEQIAPFVDEPLADSSIIPSFLVSSLTRQHVTVALGGDGGDELFGGYSIYANSITDAMRFRWIPGQLFRMAAAFAASLPAGFRGRNRIHSLKDGPLFQVIWGTPYFDITLRRRIMKREQVEALGSELSAPEQWLISLYRSGRDSIDSMTRMHFGSVLPNDFLSKVDQTSMAHSLEIRAPLLDHRLIELAFGSIPSRWKVWGNDSRRIQKLLARKLLPPDLDTTRKQGFSVPLDEWLRTDKCKIVREWKQFLPSCIEPGEVENLIQGEMKGRANGSRLFALLMLSIATKNRG
jgi:asparagine synthase (glutamine-hydrolysing)